MIFLVGDGRDGYVLSGIDTSMDTGCRLAVNFRKKSIILLSCQGGYRDVKIDSKPMEDTTTEHKEMP